jgi:4a-hydroxytetrahydrobiopterin dehydratase
LTQSIIGELELTALAHKKCVPCDGKTPRITGEDGQRYLRELPGWTIGENQIDKEFKFSNYLDGVEFAYSLGKTAEEEDHHPDIVIKWRRVKVTLTTHAIKGLSENDFIMAARAEEIYKKLQFAHIALLLYERRMKRSEQRSAVGPLQK